MKQFFMWFSVVKLLIKSPIKFETFAWAHYVNFCRLSRKLIRLVPSTNVITDLQVNTFSLFSSTFRSEYLRTSNTVQMNNYHFNCIFTTTVDKRILVFFMPIKWLLIFFFRFFPFVFVSPLFLWFFLLMFSTTTVTKK